MHSRRLSPQEREICVGTSPRSATGLGWEYYEKGLEITQNPFPDWCDEYQEFRQGWMYAKKAADKLRERSAKKKKKRSC